MNPTPPAARRILVIDDDHNIVELITLGLTKQGYAVLAAHDGQSGFDLAKTHLPNLIILDVNMPRMDGWDTLKRLRSTLQTQKIPIIMLTTEGLIKDVDKAMTLGATGYLVKPLDMNRMIKKVQVTLG